MTATGRSIPARRVDEACDPEGSRRMFSSEKFDARYADIVLVQTCGACPEQYDAFIGDRQVGYLRLRWGEFRVDYPDCGGETIYQAAIGDWLQGAFDEQQWSHYLEAAKAAIRQRLALDKL
jgi:hypothetical protein